MKEVNAENQISRFVLRGYKSIAECDLKLGRLNVLIGANGAGKSNFLGFFRIIFRIFNRQLQLAVAEMGGPDALLHFGRKRTEEMRAELCFGNNGYRFTLRPTGNNRMMFAPEEIWWNKRGDVHSESGHFESCYVQKKFRFRFWKYVVPTMRSWRLYHFHDTSPSAWVKRVHGINDNEYLRDDARNLAAFLYRLKQYHAQHYDRIVWAIQLVAPFFGDFHLRPTVGNSEKIQLEWTEKGQDVPFPASALSDGTLRFICLATVLLQPEEFMPAVILIDEPELGLHPFAIAVLAEMMKSASQDRQLIVSTQSVELVNEFDAEDLIVADKQEQATVLRRLDTEDLSEWLGEYSLGELWKKNLLGGGPV
ncbi:MAG: AAA family ATPase [Azoarcus sp.]|jgi:predicted ATPase|nr:AAA family ATPase [Azoarcus sp.]